MPASRGVQPGFGGEYDNGTQGTLRARRAAAVEQAAQPAATAPPTSAAPTTTVRRLRDRRCKAAIKTAQTRNSTTTTTVPFLTVPDVGGLTLAAAARGPIKGRSVSEAAQTSDQPSRLSHPPNRVRPMHDLSNPRAAWPSIPPARPLVGATRPLARQPQPLIRLTRPLARQPQPLIRLTRPSARQA